MRAGDANPDYRATLRRMCREDPLFYINTFVWTYDPRKTPARIPFITYPYQDDAIVGVLEAIGSHDLIIEKSRDMGASWMILTCFEYCWHFMDQCSFLMVSRNEDYVDKPGNPKSLFWKVDFIHRHLPEWMLPDMKRTKLRLTNEQTGSSIDGESTTGDVARGDRRTAILLDEFAAFNIDDSYRAASATRDATNSRLFNSTPQGSSGAFFDLVKNTEIKKLRLHWTLHPEKAEGLYYDDRTGMRRPRSPWYDNECKRVAHPVEIAQELDIDYAGSDYQFFDQMMLRQYVADHCRPWVLRGDIDYDPISGMPRGFQKRRGGPLKLWREPDAKGLFPTDRNYLIGVDVATGTGATNTCFSVVDTKACEKIAEWSNSRMRPDECATVAVALARWFKGMHSEGAYLIWEANGPGANFGDAIIKLGFTHVYFRKSTTKLAPNPTDMPGWYSSADSKLKLLSDYRQALSTGEFINRSRHSVEDCAQWIYTDNGRIAHSQSQRTIDPTAAKSNHADMPTADALAWHGIGRPRIRKPPAPRVAPNSMMGRRMEAEKRKRERILAW
jgi:hypothetical protein